MLNRASRSILLVCPTPLAHGGPGGVLPFIYPILVTDGLRWNKWHGLDGRGIHCFGGWSVVGSTTWSL